MKRFLYAIKRRPFRWLGILLAIGLVLTFAIPASHDWLIGVLQDEALYDGQPTSYWVSALKKQGYFGTDGPPSDVAKTLLQAGPAAVPVLVDMLQEEGYDPRYRALLILSAMKPGEAAEAVPALERMLLDEKTEWQLRALAQRALVRADEEAAIRTLIGMLKSGEKNRDWATDALGGMGPKAKAAVQALRVVLDDQNPRVGSQAAQALWRIERRADTKLLLTLAQGPVASNLWKEIASETPKAVPDLLQSLQNADAAIRL